MDKILVRNLKIFAYHGVNPEEKENGQNFVLDIDVYVDISVPCVSDNVDDTVSYAKIIKETVKIFTCQKDDLLERAAQRVACKWSWNGCSQRKFRQNPQTAYSAKKTRSSHQGGF